MTRTLSDDLRSAAAARPQRPAVIAPAGQMTYAELDRSADLVAAQLLAHGVQPGDRVATMMANGLDAVKAVYGVMRAGAALVPLNPTLKPAKLGHLLRHSGAVVLLCDRGRGTVARAGASQVAGTTVVDELEAGTTTTEAASVSSLDLAAVIYTSGSTGEPKGVTLNQRNMTFVADSMIEYLEMDGSDRVLCVLPLSFGYGLYQLVTCVRTASTLVLEPGFSFPGRVVGLLEEHEITALPGVPTLFSVLLSLRGLGQRSFPDLRVITNAGAALSPASVKAMRTAFPATRIYSMYGQTECQRVSYLPPDQIDIRPGSVGVAIPGTEVWVEDEDANVAAPGAVGELMVRGEHVMQGYWQDAERTAQRLRPGRWPWERVLATGDLFRTDDEGYLYFVARRDDIIKSGGEKVAPREVEEVLLEADGVREAAVFGVNDPLLGEAVHAQVSPLPGVELDVAALRRHCAATLEDHMVPRVIVVCDELPRTHNGKVDRHALRAPRRPRPAPSRR